MEAPQSHTRVSPIHATLSSSILSISRTKEGGTMVRSSQRRREIRSPTLVHVRWMNRASEGASAELFDVSASGVFLVPLGEIPESVGVGDTVWIILQQPDGEKTLTGTVRWRGFSQAHGSIGCGVLLEQNSLALCAAIFKP
jgi:hypothetical protein